MPRIAMLPVSILLALAGTGGANAYDPPPPAAAPALTRQQSMELSREAQVTAEMALPDDLRVAVDALRLDRGVQSLDRVRRLYEFMVGPEGLALLYRETPTYGIAESYARREVNCLSFTMMFIALARHVGLDAYAQASGDALAMRVMDDTLYRTRHVKAGVDIDGLQYTVDVGWRSVVAEDRPHRISDRELVALLHSNNAIEQLMAGNFELATLETGKMLALDTGSAAIWNNAGVVHWRSGRHDAAEQAYLKALSLERKHIEALSNLVVLHKAAGDTRLAEKYEAELERARASDPFSQFLAAQQLQARGQYADALAHYRRAIRLLPNEATFHRGMAEAYRLQGNTSAAQRALNRADSIDLRKNAQRGIQDVDTNS